MIKHLHRKILFTIAIIWSSTFSAYANNELTKFLKKQGFPVIPSEEFFISNGMTKNMYKYGSKDNSCKTAGEFYYAESFNQNAQPWYGIISKTVVAASSEIDVSIKGEIQYKEYEKIRKKFGTPTEDVWSPLTGFRGGKRMLYDFNYQGIPVQVHFIVDPHYGCFLVQTTYFIPSKPKADPTAISDALK